MFTGSFNTQWVQSQSGLHKNVSQDNNKIIHCFLIGHNWFPSYAPEGLSKKRKCSAGLCWSLGSPSSVFLYKWWRSRIPCPRAQLSSSLLVFVFAWVLGDGKNNTDLEIWTVLHWDRADTSALSPGHHIEDPALLGGANPGSLVDMGRV